MMAKIGLVLAITAMGPIARPAVAEVAAPSSAAEQLAGVLASDPAVLAQVSRVLHDQTPKVLAADPQFQVLEKRWPGITTDFVAVLEPIVVKYTRRSLPAYRARVAALFAQRMSPAELGQVRDFYVSPAGRHVLDLVQGGIDFSDILKRQVATAGEGSIESADLRAAVVPGVQRTMAELPAEDRAKLIAFAMTPAGRKMNELNPELAALAAQNANAKDPAMTAEIGTAVTAMMGRRMAAEKQK